MLDKRSKANLDEAISKLLVKELWPTNLYSVTQYICNATTCQSLLRLTAHHLFSRSS
jgi:hypothetical protein